MTAPGWQKVATLAAFGSRNLADVVVGRELVVLVRRSTGVEAYQGLCPHEYARLSEGRLETDDEGDWLTCSRHLARFRLGDGVCPRGWRLPPLRRYAVRVEDDAVWLADPLAPL